MKVQYLPTITAQHRNHLEVLGENIKLLRLRRSLSIESVCERANIEAETLIQIELGSPDVILGHYYEVLKVYGLEMEFINIGSTDHIGNRLQNLNLLNPPEE